MYYFLKVVVIGGGIGLLIILCGLRDYNVDIIVIVIVVDDGGLLGILCDYVNVVFFGDICNVLVVLVEMFWIEKDIFQYCFWSID